MRKKLTGMVAGAKKTENNRLFESLEDLRSTDQKPDEAMDEPATEK